MHRLRHAGASGSSRLAAKKTLFSKGTNYDHSSTPTPPLTTIAEQINVEHAACLAAANTALDHAMRCGELLTEAKAGCEHGQWQQWLTENFNDSARTARAYMQIWDNRDAIEAKRQTSATLSIDGALRMLAPPRDNNAEEMDRTGKVFPPLTKQVRKIKMRKISMTMRKMSLVKPACLV